MLPTVVVVGLLGALIYVVNYWVKYYLALRRTIAEAKETGLPYVILPFLQSEWIWKEGHRPFRMLGGDSILTISSGHLLFWSASPEVISQISGRRNDFVKPTHMYTILNIYGRNVVSTEGALWRQHRKIASAPFSEQNNEQVWAETVEQTRSMLRQWLGDEENASDGVADDIGEDTMRLTLNVISHAGFGRSIAWPGQGGRDEVDEGHQMGYKEALETVLHNIIWIMLVPKVVLKYAPFRRLQQAHQSYYEWRQYMNEMMEARRKEMQQGNNVGGFDLMGALVRGSSNPDTISNGKDSATEPKAGLTDAEILGNAFVFILAGHETTANTIHYAMIYLAMHPDSQKRLQQDLDSILEDRPIHEWTYEEDMPRLLNSMAGAVMNETLRLVPPVTSIGKIVGGTMPQSLTVDGRTVTLRPGTIVNMNITASHRNPKVWLGEDGKEDAEDVHRFRPERWLSPLSFPSPSTSTSKSKTSSSGNGDHHQQNGSATPPTRKTADRQDGGRKPPPTPTTNKTLYYPPRGAFLPFSEGARACLGRRFAQVEIMATLAIIFRYWSVELIPNHDNTSSATTGDGSQIATEDDLDGGTDDENEKKNEKKKWEEWTLEKERAKKLLTEGMSSRITLQMRGGKVPLRIVKRGREEFY
ncbi:MAG: hypothetical protein M1823_004765 [Watsoniomyces obsoletus]|nr:MAG: hypothetical protein M1823_004765 [Watsoniomyces obsoletus]